MKKNKGITLVALIITIIIMIILVAVTISILINSGLISKAKEAADKTRTAYEQERNFGEVLNINGKLYASPQDYIKGKIYNDIEVGDVIRYGPEGSYVWSADLCASNISEMGLEDYELETNRRTYRMVCIKY